MFNRKKGFGDRGEMETYRRERHIVSIRVATRKLLIPNAKCSRELYIEEL